MRIDARIEYELVWGNYGVEWHTMGGIMSCEHCSDEALTMLMDAVLRREKGFLEDHKDDYGRIHWKCWQWKSVGETEYTTENLRLLNRTDLVEPIMQAKRNCKKS